MRCPNTLLLLAAGALCVSKTPIAHADLTWTAKTMELNAGPGASELEARFRFTNTGSTALDIRQIQTSCGCTTAALAQRHFEPGQAGEIVAHYTVGTHTGLQRKTIAVSSSDQIQPTMLTIAVHIPDIVRLQPAFLTWEHGDPAVPKILTLELAVPGAIDDLEVHSSNSAISVQVRPVTAGHKYEVSVTPPATQDFLFTALTIDYRLAGKQAAPLRAYATVKPPPLPK